MFNVLMFNILLFIQGKLACEYYQMRFTTSTIYAITSAPSTHYSIP